MRTPMLVRTMKPTQNGATAHCTVTHLISIAVFAIAIYFLSVAARGPHFTPVASAFQRAYHRTFTPGWVGNLHKVHVPKPHTVQISGAPRIFLVKDIITDYEAAAIINAAAPELERSRTGGGPKDTRGTVSEIRTSVGMFMTTEQQQALVKPIAERVERVVGIPHQRFEAMQVLRYTAGQKYIPHPDYFDGELLRSQGGRGGQRIATIVMYLNNVTHGGETEFPMIDVSVKPRIGNGVIFWSMNEDGTMEQRSVHAARPVGEGEEKWVAIYWMRESAFTY